MLTETQLAQVGNFDTATMGQLRDALGGGVDALTADGAISLLYYQTTLAVTGTDAYTLAAPTVAGQKKKITCVLAASTPAATLTITDPDDTAGFVCAATFYFDTVGQEIELVATAALKWRCIHVKRAGGAVDNVVVGTTVLTGKNLWKKYCLSITSTVSSTGTKGLPNGSAVGERCMITNSTAASTPIGNIAGTFTSMINTAYTDIGAIGVASSTTVVGDCALLEWDGAAWCVIYMNGVTLS